MSIFSRILVPVDGTNVSEGVLPWISPIARALGSTVTLLNVVADAPSTRYGGGERGPEFHFEASGSAVAVQGSEPDVLPGQSVEQAGRWLGAISGALRSEGVPTNAEIRAGDPASEIVRYASGAGSDLIAIGSHGRGVPGRGVLGSTTDRVLHASSVPMLIASPGSTVPADGWSFPTTIIAGLDGSALSELTLEPAAHLARGMGVDLRLATAFRIQASPAGVGLAGRGLESQRLDLEAEAIGYLESHAAKLRDAGLIVHVDALAGPAAVALIDLSTRHPGSLLVLGTRGQTGLSRWVLGSVTDKAVRTAKNPVLVIPPRVGTAVP